MNEADKKVYVVVLTGGPCGGKTTALERIRAHFEAQDWMVFAVPEVASVVFKAGLIYNPSNRIQALGVIENFVKTIMQLENTFFDYAEADTTNRNILIVCDRGAMDPSAFCSAEEWASILTKNGWDMSQLRDARYDHVIHMTSSATGAESSYHTTPVRREKPHLAREQDAAAAKAWLGHPCHDVLDNSAGFENKLQRAVRSISMRIGSSHLCARQHTILGGHLLKTRAFLLVSPPDENKFGHYRDFEGFGPGCWTILCKRREAGQPGHSHAILKRRPDEMVTISQRITSHQHCVLVGRCDEGHTHHHSARWRERHFLHSGHVAIVAYKQQGASVTAILRIREDLDVPAFLVVSYDVSGDPAYSPYSFPDVW
ncbi:hypothetical protein EMCRGX_G024869 [Ephydatia muelleri]